MFECDQCGACCRNLDKSLLYAELDNENGVCKYLKENKCSIYFTRPLLCRIEEGYEAYFKNIMSRIEYDRLNTESCNILKKL